jgi:Fic family protein
MNYDLLTQKKKDLDKLRPLSAALVRNLEDWFRVELTYTSNALEGNTLTRRETAVIIEKGLTVGGKTLKEHLEATNHAKALDYLYGMVPSKPSRITIKDLLTLHEIILKGLDDENAGCFRNIPVRISGSTMVMPNSRRVPDLMAEFQLWLTGKHSLHPVALAGEAHYRLVTIHPFVDGNGRTARLLMNLLLMMSGYPPAIIRLRDRLGYLGALEKAQLGGSKADYEKLIAQAVDCSLNIVLQAAKGESAEKTETEEKGEGDQLLKIGELANAVGVTVPTIRFWAKEGLLEVAEIRPSGYQMFSSEMIQRSEQIKKWKGERLTLKEIKERLG